MLYHKQLFGKISPVLCPISHLKNILQQKQENALTILKIGTQNPAFYPEYPIMKHIYKISEHYYVYWYTVFLCYRASVSFFETIAWRGRMAFILN